MIEKEKKNVKLTIKKNVNNQGLLSPFNVGDTNKVKYVKLTCARKNYLILLEYK